MATSALELLFDSQSPFEGDLGYYFPSLDVGSTHIWESDQLSLNQGQVISYNAFQRIDKDLEDVSIAATPNSRVLRRPNKQLPDPIRRTVYDNLMQFCSAIKILKLGTRIMCTRLWPILVERYSNTLEHLSIGKIDSGIMDLPRDLKLSNLKVFGVYFDFRLFIENDLTQFEHLFSVLGSNITNLKLEFQADTEKGADLFDIFRRKCPNIEYIAGASFFCLADRYAGFLISYNEQLLEANLIYIQSNADLCTQVTERCPNSVTNNVFELDDSKKLVSFPILAPHLKVLNFKQFTALENEHFVSAIARCRNLDKIGVAGLSLNQTCELLEACSIINITHLHLEVHGTGNHGLL